MWQNEVHGLGKGSDRVKIVGYGWYDIVLPGIRHFDVDRIGPDFERRIDIVAQAVADHPRARGQLDPEVLENPFERGGRLVIDDDHAILRDQVENATCPDARGLVVGVAGLRVQGRRQRAAEALQCADRAIQERGRACYGSAKLRGPHSQLIVRSMAARRAQRFVRRAERMLQSLRPEAEARAHHRVDLSVVHAVNIGFRKPGFGQHTEKLEPRIPEARRGIDEGVVEVYEDQADITVQKHEGSYYGRMRTRRFGRTGWDVSEIGYGAWQIGGNMWGPVSERDAEAVIETALEAGITFFDTALAYGEGRSERVLGGVLRRTGMRNSVRVATKIPPKDRKWPARHDSALRDVFPHAWITECTHRSIDALDFEPDLQQLHVWSDSWADDPEWHEALLALKEEGLIRAFGVSVNDHDPGSAMRVTASGRIDSLQVIYNVFDQTPEQDLFPAALENDVAVIVRVALDEGSLGGKLTKETTFAEDDVRSRYFRGKRLGETVDRVEKLRPILETKDQTLAQGALRFALSHEAVSTVIVGTTKPHHIKDNADVSERGPLDEETLDALRSHAWPRNFYDPD